MSAQSSRVTVATSASPSRAASSAATALSTPPDIATSVRFGAACERAAGADRRAERAVHRVRDEIGGVQLAGAQAAERGRDLRGADARGVEQPGALDELDGGAARGEHRPAARGLEAGRAHALTVDGEREAHEIAAGAAAGRAVRRPRHLATTAARARQVILEALVGHCRRV